MNKKIKIFIIVLFGLAAAVRCSAFQVGPLKQEVSIAPGSPKQIVAVSIVNSSGAKRNYEIKVLGAKQNENGTVVYGAGISEAEKWIIPEKELITLLPHEAKDVMYDIRVPNTAAAGSYYLGLTVEQENEASGQVGVTGQIISVLMLQVAGEVNESLSVVEADVPKIKFGKSWGYTLGIKNNGAATVPVNADVTVRNYFNQHKFHETIAGNMQLLPGAARKYGGTIKLAGFNLPGPYEVQYDIKYGLTGQTISFMKTVWYFPPCVLSMLAVIVIIMCVFARKYKKRASPEV